jgi:formamidopyrimidine-DNA glycosylase
VPELPEVETVRRGLEDVLPGRMVETVRVTGRRTVRRQSSRELGDRLTGRRLGQPERRGKYLALPLDDDQVLVIHLRMSGQLLHLPRPRSVPVAAHTHVRVGLDDGSELRFVDPRTFGEWYVTDELRADGLPREFDRLGPDPVVDGLSVATLRERLAHKRTPLKSALTDQRVIAGIGNLYADEICHVAEVRPDRSTDGLEPAELRRLARATSSVLGEAVRLRGSSLRDARYVDVAGEYGRYQQHHRVYDRAGEPCLRCGAPIEKIRFGARVAYCCPGCQR